MKIQWLWIAVLLSGCAAKNHVHTYAMPGAIDLKAPCEIKDGRLDKDCKFLLSRVEIKTDGKK